MCFEYGYYILSHNKYLMHHNNYQEKKDQYPILPIYHLQYLHQQKEQRYKYPEISILTACKYHYCNLVLVYH